MAPLNPHPNHAIANYSVLVTGLTGYIAQHLVKLLIEKGYRVIGQVRSKEKGERLKSNLGSDSFSYEVIQGLEVKGALDPILQKRKDIRAIFHTASPVLFESKDVYNEIFVPAVEGTKNVLESIYLHAPQVKKLVVTSSLAALASYDQNMDPNFIIDETNYNNTTMEETLKNGSNGYYGAKTFAERAVWDFKRNKYPNFEVTMIMPSYTIGPQAFDSEVNGNQLNTTAQWVADLLKLKPEDSIPGFLDSQIDVRDIARAHVVALENPMTNGKRYFMRLSRTNMQQILDIIHKHFPKEFGHLPKGKPITDYYNEIFVKAAYIDDTETRKIMDFDYISLEQTIIDTINQILRTK